MTLGLLLVFPVLFIDYVVGDLEMCDSNLLLKNPLLLYKHLRNQMTFKPNVPMAGAATHSPSKPCRLCGDRGTEFWSKEERGRAETTFPCQLIQTVPQDLLSLLLPVAEQRIL